jgi:hypothetical protein
MKENNVKIVGGSNMEKAMLHLNLIFLMMTLRFFYQQILLIILTSIPIMTLIKLNKKYNPNFISEESSVPLNL